MFLFFSLHFWSHTITWLSTLVIRFEGERSMKIKNSKSWAREKYFSTARIIPCDCERKIVFLMLGHHMPGVPWNRITEIKNIKLFSVQSRTITLHQRHLKSQLKNVIFVVSRMFEFDRSVVCSVENCFALITKTRGRFFSQSFETEPTIFGH